MAIQLTAGDQLRSWATHTPGDGLSIVYTERSDGTSFTDTLTLTDRGDGVWRLTGDTDPDDPHGEWYVVLEGDNGTRYDQIFDVMPVPAHYDKVW